MCRVRITVLAAANRGCPTPADVETLDFVFFTAWARCATNCPCEPGNLRLEAPANPESGVSALECPDFELITSAGSSFNH